MIKIQPNTILIYLAAFFIVLGNGSIYGHISGVGSLEAIITYFPAVIFVYLSIAHINKDRVKTNQTIFIFTILLILFLLIILITSSDIKNSIATSLLFLSIFLYVNIVENSKIMQLYKAYSDIIFLLAIISLFFWVFGTVLNVIQPVGNIYHNWGSYQNNSLISVKNYYYVYFGHVTETYLFNMWIPTNNSIFVERAFAAYSFGFALVYELFLTDRTKKIRSITLLIALISTFSTTGLILGLLTIVLYFLTKRNANVFLSLTKYILIPLIFIFSIAIIEFLLETKMSMGHSYSSRVSDFLVGIEYWMKKPLFGYGYGNYSNIDTGYSNSITMVLMTGGIVLFSLYVFSFAKGIYFSLKYKRYNTLSAIIILILYLSTTAIAFRPITFYIMLLIVRNFGKDKRKIICTTKRYQL